MVITVIGGGNIGTLMAAELAARGHKVRMLTSRPEIWQRAIDICDREGNVVATGHLECVTADIGEAMDATELAWITHPTYMLEDSAAALLPYAHEKLSIGIVPGNDAEFFFQEHVRKGATVFGLQRVHSIARLKERGRSVYMLGRKSDLQVAALHASQTPKTVDMVGQLFDMPAIALPHFLTETLTPSNPILHTTRIRTLFRNWGPGVFYDHNLPFYETWDDESSELLLACDDELQQLCRTLETAMDIDLSAVKSLRDHYESPNTHAMTDKLSHIPAFKGIGSPMKEASPGKWMPDFESRYFKADFAFGLKAIKDIAVLAKSPAPCIDEVYDWYISVSENQSVLDAVPNTLDEMAALYG